MPWTRKETTELEFSCYSGVLKGSLISLQQQDLGDIGKLLGQIIFSFDSDLDFDEDKFISMHDLLKKSCSQVLITSGTGEISEKYKFFIVPGEKKFEAFIKCVNEINSLEPLAEQDLKDIIALVSKKEIKTNEQVEAKELNVQPAF